MPRFSLRLFFRVTSKNREVYLLKVITLALAFASSTLVILFSLGEFRYDRHHRDANQVFRLIKKNTSELHQGNRLSTKIPFDVYNKLNSLTADSLIVSRLSIMKGLAVTGDRNDVYVRKIHAADRAITEILSFDVLDGSLTDFGKETRDAIVSASVAKMLFGTIRANGKSLLVCSQQDTLEFTVTGVYRDLAPGAHEVFDIIVSYDTTGIEILGYNSREAGVYGRAVFPDVAGLEARIQSRINDNELIYSLQPLPEIYFGPRVIGEDAVHGDSYSILILLCLTGLILFLALTTYVNLTSLTLPHRSKELAIRKLSGTSQLDLLMIFFKESFVIVVVSFLLGIVVLFLVADLIESILSVNPFSSVLRGDFSVLPVIFGILLILMIGPLFLTFRFIKASPARLLSTEQITFPRFKKTITVLQLGVSIFLIVSSMVIKRQINYSLLKEPGRNHDQVVYLTYPKNLTKEGLLRIRSGWQAYHPNIIDVIALSQLPDRISSKEVNSPFYSLSVDPFFPGFFKLNIIRGYWFGPNTPDSIFAVNDRGLKYLTMDESESVGGVIEDINSQFNQPQKPIRFKIDDNAGYHYLCVRILEVDIRRTIDYLSAFFDGAPVHILSSRFNDWLHYQDRLNYLSNLLGIISLLLSCCAIYGLSVSLVRDKLKQIAVHKICGASIRNITFLLAREFVRATMVALLIFGPLTYIFLSEWLRNFVYATHFSWADPVLPLAYCILITMLLCTFQAFTLHRKDLTSALKN